MLENEINSLKQKHDENKRAAYINIIHSEDKSYKRPVEIILDYLGIDGKITADTFEKQLDELKYNYNVEYRIVTLNNNWDKNSMLPLLVKENGVFYAAIPDYKGKCKIYKNNKREYIKDTSSFDNKALCFYKGFEKETISRQYLIKYMLSCVSIWEYIAVFAAMLAVMLFSTVIPKAQYYIFNNLIPSGTRDDILAVSSLLFGVIVINFILYILRGFITANIPLVISANLQGAVASRLLRLKIAFFVNQKAGKLSNGILRISDISNIFSGEVITALFSFILSFIYAQQIYIYAKEFMVYVFIAVMVVLSLVIVRTVSANRYSTRLAEKENDMTGFVYELFGGMENVKLNNADAFMFNRWSSFYADTLKAYKKPLIIKYYNGIYTLVISTLTLLIFITGIRNDTNAAGFIAFMSLYGLFIASVGGISTVLNSAADFNSVYNNLKDFFNGECERASNKYSAENFEGNVEFSNVSFKYPENTDYVLENISFSIKKGQKLGITGKSGCGKSTLIRLLLGFEKPDNGRIFIDDRDLNEINLSSYRQKLGVVLQSSKLIPADIYSNITLTAPTASYEEVNAVIEIVGLKEDIEKMPMGLYTFVSDDNLTISGGQKQRILLARAILSKPKLLVLDEATNALDNITQSAITRYVENSDSTAVIVAHRLSTIKQCDNIIVLDGGAIIEQGSFSELIENKGAFYNLVKNQLV